MSYNRLKKKVHYLKTIIFHMNLIKKNHNKILKINKSSLNRSIYLSIYNISALLIHHPPSARYGH